MSDTDPEAVSFRADSESFGGHTTSHASRSADLGARDGLRRAHSEKHRATADESIGKPAADTADIEREANELAAEVLIDKATWRRSHAHLSPSAQAIHDFATRMQVSPAVVAGRIQVKGALLVGEDGIAVEGFPSRPVSQWLVN